MAFTVSEYNHPEPNQYAAEGFPMIAAFAAFQGWDAVYSFCYSGDADFEPRRIPGFFDIKSVTPRLVHVPACAAMFLRGDVAAAKTTLVAPLTRETERSNLRDALNAWNLTTAALGLDPRNSLLHAIALDIGKRGPLAPAGPKASLPKEQTVFVSDTGQLRWDAGQKGGGYFLVDAPRSKLFTGFVRGRSFDLGGAQLTIGKTRLDWATVSLVALDGAGFDRPGRILIAATGVAQNEGAHLESRGGDTVTLGNRWGAAPVLCEGVAAEIVLPVPAARVKFYPLDEAGNRREAVPATSRGAKAVLALGPEHKTLWYEVEVQ
jgi:hypothetical protein